MTNKFTFDDLIAEAERNFKAIEVEGPDGKVYTFRSLAVLPRHERKAAIAIAKKTSNPDADADAREDALDELLLSVVDDPENFIAVLDQLPLGAKTSLVGHWAKGTQAPEA